jgi:hypothetical protein
MCGLSGVEVEPEHSRFDRLCAVHVEVQCGGAPDRGLARDLDAILNQSVDEVLALAIHPRVEDRDGCVRVWIT